MQQQTAASAGQFTIGGDITVNRLGFGAMRLTGKGIWGEPADPRGRDAHPPPRAGARHQLHRHRRQLRAVRQRGPDPRDAASLSADLTIATKGGLTRLGPDIWQPVGRPEYLRQCALMSLRRLGVERIDLWQLHRLDPRMCRAMSSSGPIAEMRRDGLIRHVGLSKVVGRGHRGGRVAIFRSPRCRTATTSSTAAARTCWTICEQSRVSASSPGRRSPPARLPGPARSSATIAERLHVSPGQLALAWVLKRSPVMLPIPGTANPDHLAQNLAAAGRGAERGGFPGAGRAGPRGVAWLTGRWHERAVVHDRPLDADRRASSSRCCARPAPTW